MNKRTWVILGATSLIAKAFSHQAASEGHDVLLVGRKEAQLNMIASDIRLRYDIHCEVVTIDFSQDITTLLKLFAEHQQEMDLFIAHSLMIDNDNLTLEAIHALVTVNIACTIQCIHAYWHTLQTRHRVLFISSVAASRGRAKNSLYGATKAAVEVYLQGLQQSATLSQHITIARLGYIDTHTTYGMPGIFYASPPKSCAKACWNAVTSKKRLVYHPHFWRFIMAVITHLPFYIYKKMSNL